MMQPAVASFQGEPKLSGSVRLLTLMRKGSSPGLGQVLFSAAQLYQAMERYHDKKLMLHYLHHDPPLHPRRTLDQAFFGSLRSTEWRDRDQVVFRRTCPRTMRRVDDPIEDTKLQVDAMDSGAIHGVTMEARLVMVDQLWMWILDDKTIVTCFPPRFGTGDREPSGLRSVIMTRLEAHPCQQLQTVYDVALVVLGCMSDVFFDRTKKKVNELPDTNAHVSL